ncbi:piezo non-specific cation channel, r-Ras-binding domain-containing protein [Phthorimaea operculella]|nr:piezo non-specific cation channel, r-Ras-binding domain-containing protein [Phthorimaea operculella]
MFSFFRTCNSRSCCRVNHTYVYVPIPFLVMLLLQFVLIVVDRALYLRKYMLGKILFQYALIIGVHIWMFFILPFITERTFNTLAPPPMWYMMKCIYLLLSAYQIRCGYPRRIIGNFLCKSYRFLNMLSFRCFMAVPFVFELRTLMDWIWTDTSMTLMDWLKMEDIFANVYLLKCSRYVDDEFPAERGAKKSTTTKYMLGGTVLAFVIAIIWFPLVFFAFGNTVGQPNPPTDVTVKIRIGPFLPVYQMSAQSKDIELYSESDYSQLSNLFATDRTAQTFLSNYMYNDVAVVSLNANSTMKWDISPPELDRLEREAESKLDRLEREAESSECGIQHMYPSTIHTHILHVQRRGGSVPQRQLDHEVGHLTMKWDISPPELDRLEREAESKLDRLEREAESSECGIQHMYPSTIHTHILHVQRRGGSVFKRQLDHEVGHLTMKWDISPSELDRLEREAESSECDIQHMYPSTIHTHILHVQRRGGSVPQRQLDHEVGHLTTKWDISPPELDRLEREAESSECGIQHMYPSTIHTHILHVQRRGGSVPQRQLDHEVGHLTMKWDISPPELDRLEREAESNNTLIVKFTFVITRISNNPQNPPTIEDSREVELPAHDEKGQRTQERIMLSKMLTNDTTPDDWSVN